MDNRTKITREEILGLLNKPKDFRSLHNEINGLPHIIDSGGYSENSLRIALRQLKVQNKIGVTGIFDGKHKNLFYRKAS